MDSLSISGHKIYGPKGIGVLYVKTGTPWIPWLQGGSQERRRRGGTSNTAGIVGMSEAMKLSIEGLDRDVEHYQKLKDLLIECLETHFADRYHINGPGKDGAPHIINLAFPVDEDHGLDGEMLLLNLDIEGICVSNGSACTSGAMEPSHVLSGIGLSESRANSSIRVSFGRGNTIEQIEYLADRLQIVLDRMLTTAG